MFTHTVVACRPNNPSMPFHLSNSNSKSKVCLSVVELPQLPTLCVLCHVGSISEQSVSSCTNVFPRQMLKQILLFDGFSMCTHSHGAFLHVLKTYMEERKKWKSKENMSLQLGSFRTITCLVRNMITTGWASVHHDTLCCHATWQNMFVIFSITVMDDLHWLN